MRTPLVSIDLETTGLNVETDAVIEIGAVKLVNGETIDVLDTLINPGVPLPPETTHITGIRQEDLRGKPTLADFLPTLREFIGDAAIVAHNASFDVAFLRRVGLLRANPVIDTLELASVLLPRMPRYGLGSLAASLGIAMEEEHRALADAKATAALYWHLWQRALTLPEALLQEVVQTGRILKWQIVEFFAAALQDADFQPSPMRTLQPDNESHIPLQLADVVHPIPAEEVRALLGADGALSRSMPQYEPRVEQQEMAAAVIEAFNNNSHLIIEAGTGTGKSLAYLIPAALWSAQNKQRVVIATNTINLQDQLLNKDLPLMSQALNVPIKAAVMKGRANYLCPRRLEAIRRRKPTSLDDLRIFTKIMVWLQESDRGDRSEINLRFNELTAWSRLSAQDEGCTMSQCEALMEGICPFYKARQRAEASPLVIINHALLATTLDSHQLPEFDYLIIDEAHQLEEAVTNSETIRIEMPTITRRALELGDMQKGLLADLFQQLQGQVSDKQRARLQEFAMGIGTANREVILLTRRFYDELVAWARDGRAEFTGTVRVTEAHRRSSAFAPLQDLSSKLCEYLDAISDAMNNLAAYLQRLQEKNAVRSVEDIIASVVGMANFFHETRLHLHEFTHAPDAGHVYWVDISQTSDFHAIVSAPLHVGALLQHTLWERKRSVVLTSATLDAGASFDFLVDRLRLNQAVTRKIGSPFDYENSTLLFLPVDMPEPSHPNYQKMLERAIVELAAALEGRVLVLFTSYNHLRETAANISPRLALGNITVYDQATGGSRETLLEGYRANPRSVLMGTRSFWQGVDLPGDELLGLVIVKLPFAVPTDPVFAARSEGYAQPFEDYAVPDAVLRLRQGFGRLIRSKRDRGIVAILDSRITRKKYGAAFLDALPECTRVSDTVASIGTHALRWLGRSS
ncbi:helicase C-terminal domain-containing protein [Aggregatilineales bacterium SYSU G02658]